MMAAGAQIPEATLHRLRALASRAVGARLVVVFGSVARADAAPDSDVDIGVSGLGFWEGLRLGHELGAELGREPHVVDLDRATDLLRVQVAKGGVLLHEGEPDAWALFRAGAIVRWLDLAPLVALCAEGARLRLLRDRRHG
jgi:predicted nucleotidyltransferase